VDEEKSLIAVISFDDPRWSQLKGGYRISAIPVDCSLGLRLALTEKQYGMNSGEGSITKEM
jgi:hypothetical protein